MFKTLIILGLDPGKATGFGILELKDRKMIPTSDFGISQDQTILELVPLIQRADVVVIESFLVRPGHARRGSFDWDDMVAPRVIGALQSKCAELGKKVVMQSPSVKPVGYGFLGKEYKKGKKNMHYWDALAHAAYYAVKHENAVPVRTS